MKVFALKNYNSPKSSSGGAFPAIADAYYKKNNCEELYVYGAAFVESFDVHHIRVCYRNGLNPLLESKYVQSNMSTVLNSIHEDLSNGHYVLFVGTPCQVQALNRYIEKNSLNEDKVLTIDLICHGTPNNKFWNDYVAYLNKCYKGEIKEIHFRYKQGTNRRNNGLVLVMKDGKIVYSPKELYTYMRLFARNISLNNACFNCVHRNKDLRRPGDFTIGDFWGVSEVIKDFGEDKNISLVIANNSKAENIIELIEKSAGKVVVKPCKTNKWLEFNPHLHIQTKKPNQYDEFWHDYRTISFEALINKWKKEPINTKTKLFLSKAADQLGIKWKIKKLINKIKA